MEVDQMQRRAVCSLRGMPPANILNEPVSLARSPGARLVLVHGAGPMDNRIDDGPSRFDHVLTRKEGGVTHHGVAQEPLVRFHASGRPLYRTFDHDEL